MTFIDNNKGITNTLFPHRGTTTGIQALHITLEHQANFVHTSQVKCGY